MKKILYLIIRLLAFIRAVSFSAKDICSCNEFSHSQPMCEAATYCSYTGNACVNLQCQGITQSKCTSDLTQYKCGWNNQSQACENKTYQCSDITDSLKCKSEYGHDCVWQTSSETCINFTCIGIDINHCISTRCSYIDNLCGDPKTINCPTVTTCSGEIDGNGQMCMPSDGNGCKFYNIYPKNCSDYYDLEIYCMTLCTYDSKTNTCKSHSCSNFTSQISCQYVYNYYSEEITPCFWNGSSCQEATQANIETFDLFSCIVNTLEHYWWNIDSSKCIKCSALQKNSLFDYSSSHNNGLRNSTGDASNNSGQGQGNSTIISHNETSNQTNITITIKDFSTILTAIYVLLWLV